MSRQSFSKSSKGNKSDKQGSFGSSLGDAIAAKNPELAEEMAKIADNKPTYTVEKQRLTTPKIHGRENKKKKPKPPKKPNASKAQPSVNRIVEKKKKRPKVKPLVEKKKTEVKDFELLLTEIEKLEHRNDGIPSVPIKIEDKSALSLLKSAADGFNEYLGHDGQGNEVIFVIGCDFGTSSTKIVIQQAFAGGRSVALPVPEPFRPDWVQQTLGWKDRLPWGGSSKANNGHPHCWKTLLYLDDETETFSLLNGEGKKEINNIKTSVMSVANPVIARSGDVQLTPDHAAAAYLGLILRYAKGWLYKNGRQAFGLDLENYNIDWELNMGLPAASLDDKVINRRFHDILNAGWLISETNEPVTINTVYEHFIEAASNYDDFEELTSIRPEVTAEAVCLIQSDLLDFKTYVLVDIGASTLDVCVFNYFDNIDNHKQAMLVAEVKLLGAQSIEWLDEVHKPDGSNFELKHLKEAIRHHVANPIRVAKVKKDIRSPVWSGVLEILMAGGGSASEVHQSAINDFKDVFIKQTSAEDVIQRNPSVPKSLQHLASEDGAHRLAVAWGLSLSQYDFMEFVPPSKVPDMTLNKSSINDTFISKDQV